MDRDDTRRELELIAATVHDLKNPLTLIRGMSALLASDPEKNLTSQQHEQLQQLQTAAGRLGTMVESLRHVESLPYTARPQPVQLHLETTAVIDELRPGALQREVEISFRPGSLPPVLADPHSVRYMMWHLLSMTVKYAPSASEVRLQTRRQGQFVALSIETSGATAASGVSKNIEQVIGKQRQPVRQQGDSSGMSLYIVKSIVEFYGGTITTVSRQQISTIMVKLPVSNQLSLFK